MAPEPKIRSLSIALPALVVFGLFNIALAFLHPVKFNADIYPEKSFTWWTFQDLKEQRPRANVAVLGSSLMVASLGECDANYLGKSLDLSTYKNAAYLDARLAKAFGGNYQTFNLAAPGQMPSDAYLTLKAAVQEGLVPKVVIWGLAPRDFLDGTVQSPADTEAFKFLSHIVNIADIEKSVFPSPLAWIDWKLNQICYLYGQGLDFKMSLESISRQLAGKSNDEAQVRQILPSYKPSQMEAGDLVAHVTNIATLNHRDDSREYRDRYRNPSQTIYRGQMACVAEVARLCSDNGIELVLVNMPVTRKNVNWLAPGLYRGYLGDVQQLALSTGCQFVDLSDFDKYSASDFRDSVHLNGLGGRKFVDDLVSHLALRQSLYQAMVRAGGPGNEAKQLATPVAVIK